MSAEPAFYIEPILPKVLQDKAIVLRGEPSWPASDALQVVDWLSANGYEVAGVELWRNKEGKPLFVASSDYSPRLDGPVTPETLAWCAHKAAQFIVRFRHEPGALFNMTSQQPSAKLEGLNAGFTLPLYSRVRLTTDKYHSEGASCFDAGYIVEVYPDNKYEVEFSDLNGITTAQIVAGEDELQLAPEIVSAPRRAASFNPIEEH